MAKAAADVRGVGRAPGVDRVYLPGEREAMLAAERRRDGVPVPREVLDELRRDRAQVGDRVASEHELSLTSRRAKAQREEPAC